MRFIYVCSGNDVFASNVDIVDAREGGSLDLSESHSHPFARWRIHADSGFRITLRISAQTLQEKLFLTVRLSLVLKLCIREPCMIYYIASYM